MYAHSANKHSSRHRLEDHLRSTASLARDFAAPLGLAGIAWWAGLIHDGGKAWCEWQRGLLRVEGSKGRVGLDHKSYGVQLARAHKLRPVEWMVAGHHGGLTNRDEIAGLFGEDDQAEQELRTGPWTDAERVLRRLVPEIFTHVPTLPEEFADPLTGEFLVRFLYSCLVDADVLDTQAHFLGGAPRRGADLDAELLLDRFLRRRERFLSDRCREGRAAELMDPARGEVFAAALEAAELKPGLFRLTAPTGAAKTIAAAGFGLAHAARYHKRRVIVAVPFTTITDQNAAVYRGLLDPEDPRDDPVVLEHHSHVDLDARRVSGRRRAWRRAAAENWDAPFVVTTTVQLFDSLFGRTGSQLRKLHRIANSVIVLDEVQALPHRLLPQIADALRILVQRLGVTVLLSSATQPELWDLGPLKTLTADSLRPREVVKDPDALFASTRRMRFRWMPGRPTLAEVAGKVAEHERALMVVNTVAAARTAFREARRVAPAGVQVLHLSTGMCPAHRRRVLAEVDDLLAARRPVLLVSTSLVEAGVNLDFPVVFRAVGPPESLAQVAGRCNREGHLGLHGGLVMIFDPVDGGMPPPYRTQIGKAKAFFGPGKGMPDDLDRLSRYFPALYQSLGLEDPGSVAKVIEQHRWHWDFRAVAEGPLISGSSTKRNAELAFRMILDDTVPVAVFYGDAREQDALRARLERLRGPHPSIDDIRRLQPYLATVHRSTAQRPEVAARLAPVVGDLMEWRGEYDDGYGLVLEPEEGGMFP